MQRRQLVGIFKLLLLISGFLLLVPLIKSTGIFKSESSNAKGIVVDVSEVEQGQYQSIKDRAGREFWIYRWSAEDRQRHNLLDQKQAWTVVLPYEPHRGCRVHLREDMSIPMRFVEPCFNAGFDARGQRLPDTGITQQRDLPVIPFHWQAENKIRLQLSKK